MTDDPISVRKMSMFLPMSIETVSEASRLSEALGAVLRGEGPVLEPVPPQVPGWYIDLLTINGEDSLAAKTLRLHAPHQQYEHLADSFDCMGCDFGGYEGERPDWPCRTVDLPAEHFGVTHD